MPTCFFEPYDFRRPEAHGKGILFIRVVALSGHDRILDCQRLGNESGDGRDVLVAMVGFPTGKPAGKKPCDRGR